ncbi:hypothetical protein KM043_001786 [Ampulex compressa]|nr:hypothetical protein KM043_001786 [Ampulex compressa]
MRRITNPIGAINVQLLPSAPARLVEARLDEARHVVAFRFSSVLVLHEGESTEATARREFGRKRKARVDVSKRSDRSRVRARSSEGGAAGAGRFLGGWGVGGLGARGEGGKCEKGEEGQSAGRWLAPEAPARTDGARGTSKVIPSTKRRNESSPRGNGS